MGLTAQQLDQAMTALCLAEPAFAAAQGRVGAPAPRIRARGFETLLRTIVGQQVSVASADAIWRKLIAVADANPHAIAAADDAALRAAGLSRQKIAYARSLADEVLSGRLDLAALPVDDEAAIAALVRVNGIGRWSAEIYLLFAEGRADIWPAGDLAVRIEIGRILGLPERPSEREIRRLAEAWRPHRGAAAIFAWHSYLAREAGAAPM